MNGKIEDYDYPLYPKGGGTDRVIANQAEQYSAIISTVHGYVCAFFYDSPSTKASGLFFVHKGREYTRRFEGKIYTPRGLVTKAKQFASYVVSNNNGDK